MQRIFKRKISSLSQIFNFVNEILNKYNVNESASFSIILAIEELFTNMVKYNIYTDSDISISIEKNGAKIVVIMIDYNVEKFDIRKSGEIDITKSIHERKVGSLGLHLVKKMVDDLDYKYINGESRITFTKILEQIDV
ncbi:MAG: ATP-binding protein [Ignavibacteriales bacterium]|nr:ATP-binding protein [Ignavibacteriales bacterium]